MPIKKLLAIETSGKICSIALCSFNNEPCLQNTPLHEASHACEIIAEYSIHSGNKHDKFCAELCNRILKDNDIAVCDLGGVAVSIGPGSFTGLRIGLAVAKGLCFTSNEADNSMQNTNLHPEATGPQLIAVPTLNAIALNATTLLNNDDLLQQYILRESQNDSSRGLFTAHLPSANALNEEICLLAIIHSHSNMYYYQVFSADGTPASSIEFADIKSIAAQFADKLIYIGTNSKLAIDFGFYPPQLSCLTAATIGKLGAIQFAQQQFANATDVQPLYVQNFVPR